MNFGKVVTCLPGTRYSESIGPNFRAKRDPTRAHLTLKDLQREPTIYLVAECDSQEQAIEYLAARGASK